MSARIMLMIIRCRAPLVISLEFFEKISTIIKGTSVQVRSWHANMRPWDVPGEDREEKWMITRRMM